MMKLSLFIKYCMAEAEGSKPQAVIFENRKKEIETYAR